MKITLLFLILFMAYAVDGFFYPDEENGDKGTEMSASNSQGLEVDDSIGSGSRKGLCEDYLRDMDNNTVYCVKTSTMQSNFMDAVDFCDAYGGQIVTPSSKKLHYQLLWILTSKPNMMNKTLWLNGKGDGIEWEWYKSDRKSLSYNKWIEAKEPEANIDSCIAMTITGWKSMKCSEKNAFMCQFNISLPEVQQPLTNMNMARMNV